MTGGVLDSVELSVALTSNARWCSEKLAGEQLSLDSRNLTSKKSQIE